MWATTVLDHQKTDHKNFGPWIRNIGTADGLIAAQEKPFHLLKVCQLWHQNWINTVSAAVPSFAHPQLWLGSNGGARRGRHGTAGRRRCWPMRNEINMRLRGLSMKLIWWERDVSSDVERLWKAIGLLGDGFDNFDLPFTLDPRRSGLSPHFHGRLNRPTGGQILVLCRWSQLICSKCGAGRETRRQLSEGTNGLWGLTF